MGKEIMMESDIATSPDAAITVLSLMMDGCVQSLGNDAPLHCSIIDIVE